MSENADVDSVLEEAISSHEARDLDHAESLYRAVLRADPDHVEALSFLGVILQDRGRAAESLPLIRRALDLDPDFADAHANLARGHRFLAEWEEAVAAAQKAADLDPTLGEAWLQLGHSLLAVQRNPEALAALRAALAHYPESLDLHAGIGTAALRLDDPATAAEAWRTVLRAQPDRIDALVNLGAAQGNLGQLDEALRLHRRAVEIAPRDLTARGALAVTLKHRFEAPELVALCGELLDEAPERMDLLILRGIGLTWLGRFEEARAAYRRALDIQPDSVDARRQLAALAAGGVSGDTSGEDTATFAARLADAALPLTDRVVAGYVVGKSLDREGDHDAAFRAYAAANALAHEALRTRGKAFDRARMRVYTDWARAVFTPATFAATRGWGDPSEMPVFIVGMPRSGTSLIEQIAASHPNVFGLGERKDIMDLLSRINRGEGTVPPTKWDRASVERETAQHLDRLKSLGGVAARVIDKLPDNIQLLGQIAILFPNARIIVARRDLRDVCVSCLTTHFGDDMLNWTYDQEDCAIRAVEIEALMDHWRTVLPPDRVLELTYETLVGDLEAESRRLIDFLGLGWDPACLAFHKTQRQVTTASVMQVRQPLYDSSVGRWRRYEAHLGPMLRLLAGHVPADAQANTDAPASGATTEAANDEAARRGLQLLASGDAEGAARVLAEAAARFPDSPEAHANLGMALNEARRFDAAAEAWSRAATLHPDHARILANLGYALSEAGRHPEAVAANRRAVVLAPDEADFHRTLGSTLWRARDVPAARDAYAQAQALAPGHVVNALWRGHCEAALGHFRAAADCYRAVLAVNPEVTEARAALVSMGEPLTDEETAGLRATLDNEREPVADRIWAGFALGQVKDKARQHDAAFAAFRQANDLVRARNAAEGRGYDRGAFAAHVDALIAQFPASGFPAVRGMGDPSEVPVFIVGMPRSGTSLVEQIIASHPRAFGAGERTDLVEAIKAVEPRGDYAPPIVWDRTAIRAAAAAEVAALRAAAQGVAAKRVTDKLPGNLQWLGHLAVLLPRARVIVCRRDPRDIGLSCYFTHLAGGFPWSNDLGDIAAQMRDVERLLTHWRAVLPNPPLEVAYETLVGDLEAESRRLIGFLGLEWDPACLAFHETQRQVTTASASQVRQSLYTRSIGRWRPYRRHLQPLIEGLGGLIPTGNDDP